MGRAKLDPEVMRQRLEHIRAAAAQGMSAQDIAEQTGRPIGSKDRKPRKMRSTTGGTHA